MLILLLTILFPAFAEQKMHKVKPQKDTLTFQQKWTDAELKQTEARWAVIEAIDKGNAFLKKIEDMKKADKGVWNACKDVVCLRWSEVMDNLVGARMEPIPAPKWNKRDTLQMVVQDLENGYVGAKPCTPVQLLTNDEEVVRQRFEDNLEAEALEIPPICL